MSVVRRDRAYAVNYRRRNLRLASLLMARQLLGAGDGDDRLGLRPLGACEVSRFRGQQTLPLWEAVGAGRVVYVDERE